MVWSNITQSEWDIPNYYDELENWKLPREETLAVLGFAVFFTIARKFIQSRLTQVRLLPNHLIHHINNLYVFDL